MNRKDLVRAVADKTGETQINVDKILSAILESIKGELSNGGSVSIQGFGKFEARYRKERNGVNPSTGEKMVIPATHVPAFKAGKALREAVRGQ